MQQCERWLIFVEGVGYAPGAPGMDDSSMGIWWGENLAGAKTQPVRLSDPSKLVYSPHTYGPGTFMQKYFNDGAFPSNLAGLWSSRFAFLAEWSKAPVVIGEMGGWYVNQTPTLPPRVSSMPHHLLPPPLLRYTGKDQQWQDWAVRFMRDKGIGIFYFVLQPTSDDTGGLLKADWQTPEDAKLRMLAELPSTDVAELVGLPHR